MLARKENLILETKLLVVKIIKLVINLINDQFTVQ